MEYKHESFSDYIIFTLEGLFIGGEEADKMCAFLQEQIKKDAKNIILDLKDVNYIGSMVIGMLIKTNDELVNVSGKLVLCNVQKSVLEILKITKVDLILSVFDSREEAVQSFKN